MSYEPRKTVQGRTTTYSFEEPRKIFHRRKVGRLRLSRSRKKLVVFILEQYEGQCYVNDLEEMLNGAKDEIGIYVFE